MLKSKLLWVAVACVVIAGGVFAYSEQQYLAYVHSSFDNYYAFRGCTQLVSRTDTSGVCQTQGGKTITIVQFHNKWFLEGDLPDCWGDFCFGIL